MIVINGMNDLEGIVMSDSTSIVKQIVLS